MSRRGIFSRKIVTYSFWSGLHVGWYGLLDGHVTLASVSVIVTFGGWVPLFINSPKRPVRSPPINCQRYYRVIQRIAMIGILITVFLSFKMLPPRPARYKRHRNDRYGGFSGYLCLLTAIAYSSLQRLLLTDTSVSSVRYLDKFDVTDKATIQRRLTPKKKLRKAKSVLSYARSSAALERVAATSPCVAAYCSAASSSKSL
jgi:hypothetical protein